MNIVEMRSIIRQYLKHTLPPETSIEVRAISNNCLQLTMIWYNKKASSFLVAPYKGPHSKDDLIACLNNLQKEIPGLAEATMKAEGAKDVLYNLQSFGLRKENEPDEESDEDEDSDDENSDVVPEAISYENPEVEESAKKFLLTIVDLPFEDSHIKSFSQFSTFLAKEMLDNSKNKFDGKLFDFIKDMKFKTKDEAETCLFDLHKVLKDLTPQQFVYWMYHQFGIQIEKGMKYDAVSSRFYYQ